MNYDFKLISSLDKVFPCGKPLFFEETSGSMLKNERYSFQLFGTATNGRRPRVHLKLDIISPISDCIRVFSVGYVPGMIAKSPTCTDDDYITSVSSIFPDPLFPITDGKIELSVNQNRAFWFAIEPDEKYVGTFPITLRISTPEDEQIAELTYTIDIIDAVLPKQTLINTGWFHCDCLSLYYKTDAFSDQHFSIIEKYMDTYSKFGHNMILTPIFTPPLDTEIGGERLTVQLVGVTLKNGIYSFDFSNLEHFINLAQKHGIKYFEIAHLFTQWGAKSAPKIMATVDGVYKKIFGWETSSQSKEYSYFLDAFLPELDKFLQKIGVADKTYFHISDEPEPEDFENYKAANNIISAHISNYPIIDALSDYSFYEKGIVKKPVVATDHIKTFLEHNVKGLWAYYCTAQHTDVSNRFMALNSYRNRILGYQLYKYNIEGFLHWGYNFWNSQLSRRLINPYIVTDADGAYQAGEPFVVYPLNDNGEVICSLRLFVFADGIQDMRALKLLEDKIGRDAVLELLLDIDGFDCYPRNSEYILTLRKKINQKIKENL